MYGKRITAGTVTSNKGFAIVDPCYVLSDSVYYDFWEKKKNFAEGVFDYTKVLHLRLPEQLMAMAFTTTIMPTNIQLTLA